MSSDDIVPGSVEIRPSKPQLHKHTMKTSLCILCLLVVTNGSASTDKQVAQVCNRFSQNLYQNLVVTSSKNSIYSPLRPQTRVLQPYLFWAKFSNLLQLRQVPHVEILTANAIFVNPSMRIDPDFISNLAKFYQAKVSRFDLSSSGAAERQINRFVDSKTKGLIKTLLMPGTIDASTVMALVNTLYFKGTWLKQFSESHTQKADFHAPQGTIQIETMFDTRRIQIKRNFYGADVGEFSFRGGRFSLIILLPQETDGLSDQETVLTVAGVIESLFEGLTPVSVKVSLPRVKIESTYDLNSPLKALGIVKAFDANQADFQGISSEGGIFISKVVHKAVIDITETGTVAAAAATAVILSRNVMMQPPTETFYVNRPFIYFVYDRQLKLVLFQGRFTG